MLKKCQKQENIWRIEIFFVPLQQKSVMVLITTLKTIQLWKRKYFIFALSVMRVAMMIVWRNLSKQPQRKRLKTTLKRSMLDMKS